MIAVPQCAKRWKSKERRNGVTLAYEEEAHMAIKMFRLGPGKWLQVLDEWSFRTTVVTATTTYY